MKIKRFILSTAAVAIGLFASAFSTDTVVVATEYLATPMKVTVITPEAAKSTQDKFPTVYLLNGYGGDYTSWTTIQPRLGELADSYGMVMVMPDGRDSWYINSTTDPKMQMESFFTEDLVPFIDSHFPTAADPAKRAITGLSMGGHGGMYLATRHPDIWGNMGSTSGGINILPFPKKWKLEKALGAYADNPKIWEDNTVINMVPRIKKNGQNIIFDCGSEDFFAEINDDLHKKLLEAKVPHDYISRPGTHNMKYWANSVLYQLLYFHNKFQGK